MKSIIQFFTISALCVGLFVGCSSKNKDQTAENKTQNEVTKDKNMAQSGETHTETKDQGAAVKEALETVIERVQGGHNRDLWVAYRGDDESRAWKEPYNYEIPEEKLEIDKVAAKIEVILTGMNDMKFKKFLTEKESEGVWHVWLTEILYEDGTQEEVAFAFLPVGDRFMLGDID